MEVYFANKSGKPSKLLFNSAQQQKQPPQQPPRQMAVSRKSILMQDKEQTLRDRIKIGVVDLVPSKLKINPDIYAFNTTSVLASQKIENIDFLDEIQLKNKEKQQGYEEITTISKEISSLGQTKTIIKPRQSLNDPVSEIVNLLGCDAKLAHVYHQRYGSVEKAFMGYQKEQSTIEEFRKRFNVRQEEARFYL